MVYKQHNFISHSSGGAKVQDQGANRFNVHFLVHRKVTCSSVLRGRETGSFSDISSIRAWIPFIRAPSSQPNHLPKVASSNITTLEVRISTYELGRKRHRQSTAVLLILD